MVAVIFRNRRNEGGFPPPRPQGAGNPPSKPLEIAGNKRGVLLENSFPMGHPSTIHYSFIRRFS